MEGGIGGVRVLVAAEWRRGVSLASLGRRQIPVALRNLLAWGSSTSEAGASTRRSCHSGGSAIRSALRPEFSGVFIGRQQAREQRQSDVASRRALAPTPSQSDSLGGNRRLLGWLEGVCHSAGLRGFAAESPPSRNATSQSRCSFWRIAVQPSRDPRRPWRGCAVLRLHASGPLFHLFDVDTFAPDAFSKTCRRPFDAPTATA